MNEKIVDSEPFLCIEVEENSKLENLAKRFDALFPNRIIRLIINKEYSSYFYLGKKIWLYKQSNKNNQPTFTFKILLNENIINYINDDEISFLDYIGIEINNFELIGDLILNNETLPLNYSFLSNGKIHILQQYKMDVYYLYEQILKFLDCEIMFNSLNEQNNGMLIIKTETNIFSGE